MRTGLAIPTPKLNANLFRPAILICFFLSGACGLVYEIAWLRVMGVVFGNTTFATSTILASYMAGLGLGAYYIGRWIDRSKQHPVKVYAYLEMGVGVFALITPFIWELIEWMNIGFSRAFNPSFLVFSLFRFAVAFIFLLIPTFLMGGTLPVIAKYFVNQKEDTARYVGMLYALNTFGAVIGVLLSGFYLLYTVGVWQTVILTGIFNFFIFYLCYAFLKSPVLANEKIDFRSEEPSSSSATSTQSLSSAKWVLLILFGISGAASMMYEVAWTRVLAISLGSSVYAFSVMLATFLLGIALGSAFFSYLSKRFAIGIRTFALLQIFTALTALLGINVFDEMSFYFVKIYEWSQGSMPLIEFGKFLLCSLVMLPPTFAIGAMFSCFIHLYRESDDLGHEVGRAYFANTIGTILGSALTGFLVIPLIGIQDTLAFATMANASIALISFLLFPRSLTRTKWIAGSVIFLIFLGCFTLVKPWNLQVIASDTAVKPSRIKGLSQRDFVRSMKERELLFYKEGTGATVSVTKLRDNVSLAVNGKVDASTSDAFTQFFLGHLPMFLNPDAKKALVIGLGSGSTMAAVAAHPVETIHGVELEEAVIEGAEFFKGLNRNVLEDPRVEMFVNDGRNFLLVRPDLYDVIISEPSNPWMAGVANLFSLEHYHTMRKRLKPGGVVCQWLHGYSMSPEDLQMIINTFTLAYKHVSLWTSYYPDLMLIGSNEPITIDFDRVKEIYEIPEVYQDLAPHGLKTPESIFASYWLGDEALRRLSKGGRVNSDNFPLLEFSAPRHLYTNTLKANFSYLNTYRGNQWPDIINLEPPREKNSKFYNRIAGAFMLKRFMREAQVAVQESMRINPNDPELFYAQGELAYKDQKWALAEARFKKAVEAKPNFKEAHFNLAKTFEQLKKHPQALGHLQIAVKLDPENETYRKALAQSWANNGKLRESINEFNEIRKIKGDNFDILSKQMLVVFKAGTFKEQLQIAKDTIDRYPRYGGTYLRFGTILESRNLYKQALLLYMQMIEYLPYEPSGHLSLARVYEKVGEKELFQKHLKKALDLEPKLRDNPQVSKMLRL